MAALIRLSATFGRYRYAFSYENQPTAEVSQVCTQEVITVDHNTWFNYKDVQPHVELCFLAMYLYIVATR